MNKRQISLLLVAVFLLFFSTFAVQCAKVTNNKQETRAKEMTVTGKITKGYNNYVIRSKFPSMVLTILNPEPNALNEYIQSEKIVDIDVQVVTGDNIRIIRIEGREYP